MRRELVVAFAAAIALSALAFYLKDAGSAPRSYASALLEAAAWTCPPGPVCR